VAVATTPPRSDVMTSEQIAAMPDPVERLTVLCARARRKGTLPSDEAALRTSALREAVVDHGWTVPRLAAHLGRSPARLYVLLGQGQR
jgi:hypothetical protein